MGQPKDDDCIVIDGAERKVPKTCPKCGRKTVRKGNGSHREVYCRGRLETSNGGPNGLPLRACEWHATIYHHWEPPMY